MMNKYRLVKQEDDYGCAVACIAMALGVSYKAARKEVSEYWDTFKPLTHYEGLDNEDEAIILFRHGIKTIMIRPFDSINLFQFVKKRPAIMTVTSINVEGVYHGVFWTGDRLLDPSKKKKYTKEAAFKKAVAARILLNPESKFMIGLNGIKKSKAT